MHIIVCVKAVPGSTEVKMDPVTKTIVRDGGQTVINPFDACALEAALQMREQLTQIGTEARVSVLSMGIPATAELLRDCIARGADDALLLSDRAFAGADTLATSYALSRGIEWLGHADAILCGKMAVDGDTAQIGPELAGIYDIPCITDVSAIRSVDERAISAVHATDEGTDTVEAALPCVLTISNDAVPARMPSIAGVLAAQRAKVAVLGAQDSQADPARIGLSGSPTQVVRSFVPKQTQTSERIEGSAAQQATRIAELCQKEDR